MTSTSREAFEAHILEDMGEDWIAKDANGDYVERTTRRALRAWQAAIQHARDVAVKVCEEQAKEPECPERAQYCADAIKEALK